MEADKFAYFPGDSVPVEVVANSGGTVARDGQGVKVVGETADGIKVELTSAQDGTGFGMLGSDPSKFDDPDTTQADFAAGDSAGFAEVILTVPVLRVQPADAYNPSVGDLVAWGANGEVVEQTGLTLPGIGAAVTTNVGLDGNNNLVNAGASDVDVPLRGALPWGEVVGTIANEFGVGDRIAVAVKY